MPDRASAELKLILGRAARFLTQPLVLPPCPLRALHIVQLSYGATTRQTIGLFTIVVSSYIICVDYISTCTLQCCAKGLKCSEHNKLANAQMTDEARLSAMKEIVQLPDPPYNDPTLVVMCHQEYHRLAAKLGIIPSLPPAPPMPNAPLAAREAWAPEGLCRPATRAQAAPVTPSKRPVGRPRDPREPLRLAFSMEVSGIHRPIYACEDLHSDRMASVLTRSSRRVYASPVTTSASR